MIRDFDRLRTRPAALAVAALLALLPTFPPEVHGDACAGIAGLVAIAVLASLRDLPPLRTGFFALAAALAVPLARVADAPGAAVRPLTALLACAAAALVAASLPASVRSLPFWSGLLAAAGAWIGGRAVVESLWGLDAMRATVEGAAALPDADLVLGRIAEGRAYAGFPTPAALGAFLAVALGVTAGAALERTGRPRLLLAAAAALQGAGVLASRSLSAAGALVAALVLLALVSRLSAVTRRALVVAIVLAASLLVAAVVLRGRGAVDADAEGSPWALRVGNVRAAVAMASDHPWLGVGPGGFGEAFPRYRGSKDNTTRHAHSLPFDLAAELGLPIGAVLTLLFFAVFLGPLLRRPEGAAASGTAVGLAAFAVQNLADFTALLPATLGVAAIVRGLAARGAEVEVKGRVVPGGAAFALAAGAACALLAFDGLGAGSRRQARAAFAAGETAAALAHADRAVARAPWDPDTRLFRAQILEAAGRAEAREEVEKAIALVPVRPSARALRARLRAAKGDAGGALADLEEAARLYPANPEYARARDAFARALAGARP